MTDDLAFRLRALAKGKHDDLSIGEEAADRIEEMEEKVRDLLLENLFTDLGNRRTQERNFAMTPEQTAAYINAQTTLCQIELAGMLAENQHRLNCGLSVAYGEEGFKALYEKYDVFLGHNSLVTLFNGASE